MLNTLPLTAYGGQEIACDCGENHIISTESIAFGSKVVCGLKFAVEKIVPSGSAIFFVCDSTGKHFFPPAAKMLARGGYRTSSYQTYNSSPELWDDATLLTTLENSELAEAVGCPEDIRLIIGTGGGQACELAKLLATELGLPLIVLAAEADYPLYLAPFVVLNDGLKKILPCSPPTALIADTDWLAATKEEVVASGFGEIVSKLIAVFDRKVSTLVGGQSLCPFISEQALALADSALEKLESTVLSDDERTAIIMEHCLRFSALLQLSHDYSLIGGGESQASDCLERLLCFEDRQMRRAGENRFIISSCISKIYINTLKMLDNVGFVPPPDTNLRIETAAAYLGIPESALLSHLKGSSIGRQKIETYRLREYRAELLSTILAYEKKIARAVRTFKRIYSDCGYSLLGYLDHTDLSLSIALAPDLTENFTLLTQMKNMGLLDRYI